MPKLDWQSKTTILVKNAMRTDGQEFTASIAIELEPYGSNEKYRELVNSQLEDTLTNFLDSDLHPKLGG